MADYEFIYPEATNDEITSMNSLIGRYLEASKLEPTLDNLKAAYKQSLINLIRIMSLEISEFLHDRGFHDIITQQKILGTFNEHVNYHMKSILEGITFEYGTVEVDENKIITQFKPDMTNLSEYFAEVHAVAINAAIKELGDSIEQYMARDLKAMEELYAESKGWENGEEYADKVAEYAKSHDPQLIEKYGAIIFNFKQFGFNSEKFKEMISYLFYNLSMPYSEILIRYFKRTIKKDSAYNKNLSQIRYFITRFNAEIAKQKQAAEQQQSAIKEGANEMYSSIQ